MKREQPGHFVITLDFELIWGVFDKIEPKKRVEYFKTTRSVIPRILTLFEEHGIRATWATVGMLFNRNWKEWKTNIPKNLPQYENLAFSAYNFGENIRNEHTNIICFAPDLIKVIKEIEGQEIGTHTYSHYYSLEPSQTVESFRDDLKKSLEVAHAMEIEIKSLVFPRNQFNEKYLNVCKEFGIENVRSNPQTWYWKDTQKNSLLLKVFRTGDAYIGSKNKSYPITSLSMKDNQPLAQKASRLLRPYSSVKFLNVMRLKRIKAEMTSAAKKGEIYHLWWHPHNFGSNPEENLRDLKMILKHYNKCKKQYGFRSSNMQDIHTAATEVFKTNAISGEK